MRQAPVPFKSGLGGGTDEEKVGTGNWQADPGPAGPAPFEWTTNVKEMRLPSLLIQL